MDILGLQKDLEKANTTLQALMDRIAALEDKVAKDAIALETKAANDANVLADKVIAALIPQVQAVTQTANKGIEETLAMVRRLDGATFTLRLGPEENLAAQQVDVKS